MTEIDLSWFDEVLGEENEPKIVSVKSAVVDIKRETPDGKNDKDLQEAEVGIKESIVIDKDTENAHVAVEEGDSITPAEEGITAAEDGITADEDRPTPAEGGVIANEDGSTPAEGRITTADDGPTAIEGGVTAEEDRPGEDAAVEGGFTADESRPTSVEDMPTFDEDMPTFDEDKATAADDENVSVKGDDDQEEGDEESERRVSQVEMPEESQGGEGVDEEGKLHSELPTLDDVLPSSDPNFTSTPKSAKHDEEAPFIKTGRHLSVSSIDYVEHDEPQIDREHYCEMYRTLIAEHTVLMRMNAVLQQKLHEHFKKRKMDSIFKSDVPVTPEMESKYAKKLNMYYEIKTIEETEKASIEAELKSTADREQRLEAEFAEEFAALAQLERETGTGLIDSKTGNAIPDRLVERYLKRQATCTRQLAAQRLAYIKIRDKVAAKEASIRELDIVGGDLRLYDYEQLRIENQNLGDKIEEREEELLRMRERTTQAIQILAHFREKSSAVTSDMENKMYSLRELEECLEAARSNIGSLKRYRDRLRADFARESADAGLLNKPRLLRDFEEALDNGEQLTDELENMRNSCADEQSRLVDMRASIKRGNDYQTATRELFNASGGKEKRSVHSMQEEEEEMFQMK